MFRPFAFMGLGLYAGFTIASFIGNEARIFLGLLFLISGAVILFIKYKYAKSISLSLICAGFAFGIYSLNILMLPQVYASLPEGGVFIEVNGTVTDMNETSNGNFAYTVKTDDGAKIIYYSKTELGAGYYDEFSAVILLKPTGIAYRSRGILASGIDTGSAVEIKAPESMGIFKKMGGFFRELNKKASEHIKNSTDEGTGGILRGMLLGDKTGIDYNTNLEFKRAGLAHTMSVSGMHIMIFSQFISTVLAMFRTPRIAKHITVSLFVLAYAAFTGFTYPIIRAGIMAVIYHTGSIIGMENDSYSSLGLAASLIMLISPFAVRDLSFLLSFYATLGIIVLMPPITSGITNKFRIKNRIFTSVAEVFACSAGAGIFILPIAFWSFSEISVLSPLTNILTFPLINLGLITAFIAFAFLPLIPAVFDILINLAAFFMKLVELVVKLVIKIPLAYAPAGYNFIPVWFCAALILVLIGALISRSKRSYEIRTGAVLKISVSVSVVVLLAGVLANMIVNIGVYGIGIVKSEDGKESSVILFYGNRAAMICTGGTNNNVAYDAVNFLYSRGIKSLDFIISNNKNTAYINTVTEMIEVKNIVCPPEASENIDKSYGGQILNNDGINIGFEEDLSLDILDIDGRKAVLIKSGGLRIIYSENSLSGTLIEEGTDILIYNGNLSKLDNISIFGNIFLLTEQSYYENSRARIINAFEYAKVELLFRSNGNTKVNYWKREVFDGLY